MHEAKPNESDDTQKSSEGVQQETGLQNDIQHLAEEEQTPVSSEVDLPPQEESDKKEPDQELEGKTNEQAQSSPTESNTTHKDVEKAQQEPELQSEVQHVAEENVTTAASQVDLPSKEVSASEQKVIDEGEVVQESQTTVDEPTGKPTDSNVNHDHSEHEEDDHEHHDEELDFEKLSKTELVHFIVDLNKETNMRRVDRLLKRIRPAFDHFFESSKAEALEKFTDEGNDEEDFAFKGDEEDRRFIDYYDLLRDKKQQFFHQLEKQKEDNYKKKLDLLDQIRELVDGEESNASFKAVRELQDEWKKIGPVLGQHNKTLWANYNALLDRFYDARSIYFELKELDRKKNLESKLELCEKAESLDELENVKDAVIQLNELHEEFKHIGPVPKDDQEALWVRFKAASDKIYIKRKEFVQELKHELVDNMEKKLRLGEEAESFTQFNSDRITDWNAKTKEIQQLQKKWEAIGSLPREKAKEVNKKFWNSFKQFFSNKSAFFKQFESQREDNLRKKEELVAQAEAMKDSEDWNKATESYKNLQRQWKDIGPVPEKVRNEVYKKFKAACDHFFDRRRAQNQGQGQEYEANYQQKLAICEQIEKRAAEETLDLNQIYDLVDEYEEIGFVPRNAIKSMHTRFDEVIAMIIDHQDLADEDKNEFKINIQVNRMKHSPHGGQRIHKKENAIKRRISNLEHDINTLKTNMDFFASSKKADQLKEEMEEKIRKSTKELEDLKHQLRVLRQA